MIFQVRTLALLCCIQIFISLPIFSWADEADDEVLPRSWYLRPEDATSDVMPQDFRELGEITPKPITTILGSIESSLDLFGNKLDLMDAGSARKKGGWHFSHLSTKVAVRANGMIGLLVGGGSFSTEIDWKLRKKSPMTVGSRKNSLPISPTSFSVLDTDQQVLLKVEPILKGLIASGKIKEKKIPIFRANFQEQVLRHHQIFRGFSAIGSQRWRPTHFYLFLRFNAGGLIHPNVTLEGGIVSMLTWSIDNSKDGFPHLNDGLQTARASLQEYVYSLGGVLDQVDEARLNDQQFYLKSVGLSLGITASGLVGPVFAAGGISAGLSFSKREVPLDRYNQLVKSESINLIEVQPTPEHINFAKNNNVVHRWDNHETVIYKIPLPNFSKGIAKAMDIGTFFAKKANSSKNPMARWYASEIESWFSLSISGLTAMANLGVSANVKLNISNKLESGGRIQ